MKTYTINIHYQHYMFRIPEKHMLLMENFRSILNQIKRKYTVVNQHIYNCEVCIEVDEDIDDAVKTLISIIGRGFCMTEMPETLREMILPKECIDVQRIRGVWNIHKSMV